MHLRKVLDEYYFKFRNKQMSFFNIKKESKILIVAARNYKQQVIKTGLYF